MDPTGLISCIQRHAAFLLLMVVAAGCESRDAPSTSVSPQPQEPLSPVECLQKTFHGKVIRIVDADTFDILADGEKHRIQLDAVDSPEPDQPFSAEARQFTAGLALGQEVTAEVVDVDAYNRVVSEVFLPDGRRLNVELVSAGSAWWTADFAPDDHVLKDLEAKARKEKSGLWADENPIPPWEWRATKREPRQTSEPAVAPARLVEQPAASAEEYWLNASSGVRHNSTCEHFKKTKRGRLCRADEGRAYGLVEGSTVGRYPDEDDGLDQPSCIGYEIASMRRTDMRTFRWRGLFLGRVIRYSGVGTIVRSKPPRRRH